MWRESACVFHLAGMGIYFHLAGMGIQETDHNKQDMLSNNVNFKSVEWPNINTLLQD